MSSSVVHLVSPLSCVSASDAISPMSVRKPRTLVSSYIVLQCRPTMSEVCLWRCSMTSRNESARATRCDYYCASFCYNCHDTSRKNVTISRIQHSTDVNEHTHCLTSGAVTVGSDRSSSWAVENAIDTCTLRSTVSVYGYSMSPCSVQSLRSRRRIAITQQ